uniref:Nucleotide modification associated domain-containing protein n=1 Tax=viral metagenome TaxID=1070528 RepID=A0A6C0F2Z0_9ZZZZ
MDVNNNSRVSQMIQVQQSALELFKKKNADYGDAFAKFGVIGVIVRIEDKIQRSLSISKNGIYLVDDEKIRDTLIDLHNYAAMAIMLLDEDDSNLSIPPL